MHRGPLTSCCHLWWDGAHRKSWNVPVRGRCGRVWKGYATTRAGEGDAGARRSPGKRYYCSTPETTTRVEGESDVCV